MKTSNRLVFFGNERLATATPTTAPILKALVAAGYKIEAVITSHQEAVSRQKRDLEIGPVAHSYNIPVILLGNKGNLLSKVQRHKTEAAVLVAFGQIIPRAVLESFPEGIINVHPSLLPKLRGPTPVETAILDGLPETGVSIIKLSRAMDAGPIYAQEKLALSGNETKFELAEKLLQLGAKLLVDNLGDILSGRLAPSPQDGSQATYTRLLQKQDGIIDWSKPAVTIEREVRAYLGFPKSQAKLGGHNVVITRTRVARSGDDGVLVQECGQGFLEILELIAPSGRKISGRDFKNGYL